MIIIRFIMHLVAILRSIYSISYTLKFYFSSIRKTKNTSKITIKHTFSTYLGVFPRKVFLFIVFLFVMFSSETLSLKLLLKESHLVCFGYISYFLFLK